MGEASINTRFFEPDPAQIATLLRELAYPTDKRQVHEHALRRGAKPDVLTAFERLPDRTFQNIGDLESELDRIVVKAYGKGKL